MSDLSAESRTNQSAGGILRLSLSVCLIVIVAYVFTTNRIDETIRAALAIFLFGSLVSGVTTRLALILWPLVTIGLFASLVARPTDVPNHHWMMTYLSAAISIAMLYNNNHASRVEDLCQSARWLLIVLMAAATIQKLLSPHFIDGTYIGFELTRGGFATPVLKLIPETRDVVLANVELVQKLHTTPPAELAEVQLTSPFPRAKLVAYGFTASILLMEAWLCLSMWLIPTRIITHLSLIAFASTLAVLRQEFTFISVVCTMGLLAAPPTNSRLRYLYAFLAVVIASLVLKTLND